MKVNSRKLVPPVVARTRRENIPGYRDNPLIRELPAILSNKQWKVLLTSEPPYSEDERFLSADERMHCVLKLKKVFVPMTRHLELREKFDLLIRHGYSQVELDSVKRHRISQARYDALQNGDIEAAHVEATASPECFTLVGFSGLGKTFTTKRLLDYLPRSKVNEESGITQIPALFVECPHRQSTKHVALAILKAVDKVLGTSYYRENRRLSEDDLIEVIADVLDEYFVGVLIIDELQNISTRHSGGQEEFINFFLRLVNEVRRPIMFIGTMKAVRVLQQTFRQARRQSSFGTLLWKNIEYGKEWEKLIRVYLRYQWTHEIVPYSDELAERLYDLTQGIPALLTSLYMLAQIRLIRHEDTAQRRGDPMPRLTARLLEAVAADNFKPLEPMLAAIRSGDPVRMAKYEDLELPNLEEMTAIEGRWARVDLRDALAPDAVKGRTDHTSARAFEALRQLMSPSLAKAQIETILKDNPFAAADEVVVEALARANGVSNRRRRPPSKSTGSHVAQSKQASGVAAGYEDFAQRGLIKPLDGAGGDEPNHDDG